MSWLNVLKVFVRIYYIGFFFFFAATHLGYVVLYMMNAIPSWSMKDQANSNW